MELALIVVGLLLAAFVVAELLARAGLAAWGRYYCWTPSSRSRMPLDSAVFPHGDALVRFEVNSAGERGSVLPHEWSSTYRILVAGGSAAECYFLDQSSSWPELVASALRQPDNLSKLGVRDVYVGNVARSLVECRQIAYMLSKLLPRYERLDCAILMVGASDLVHWLEKHTPERIEEESIEPTTVFARHPEGPFGWTPSSLALRRIVSMLDKRLRRPIEVRERAGKRLAKNRAMRAAAKEIRTRIADPAPMLAHYETNLRELVRLVQGKAKLVLVVRQPWFEKDFTPEERRMLWMFGDGRAYAEDVQSYYDHRVIWPIFQEVDAITARVTRELGAQELDLMPHLPRDLETYYDELHHTPAGCRLVAEHVARAILSGTRGERV